ncbi:hypothetical protein [Desulfoferrobacter suflitae]|nr:hypothetical protein [Desulfoferrobacter suflitae]MCK8600124.1 hypothetical protein [Desulfoferrobacter suflitae]
MAWRRPAIRSALQFWQPALILVHLVTGFQVHSVHSIFEQVAIAQGSS